MAMSKCTCFQQYVDQQNRSLLQQKPTLNVGYFNKYWCAEKRNFVVALKGVLLNTDEVIANGFQP
jgi:hypothetical protein